MSNLLFAVYHETFHANTICMSIAQIFYLIDELNMKFFVSLICELLRCLILKDIECVDTTQTFPVHIVTYNVQRSVSTHLTVTSS